MRHEELFRTRARAEEIRGLEEEILSILDGAAEEIRGLEPIEPAPFQKVAEEIEHIIRREVGLDRVHRIEDPWEAVEGLEKAVEELAQGPLEAASSPALHAAQHALTAYRLFLSHRYSREAARHGLRGEIDPAGARALDALEAAQAAERGAADAYSRVDARKAQKKAQALLDAVERMTQ